MACIYHIIFMDLFINNEIILKLLSILENFIHYGVKILNFKVAQYAKIQF